MSVALVSHPDCGRHDTGWGHPEHVGRLRAIPLALRNDPELFHTVEHVEGRQATVSDISLLHAAAYIAQLEAFSNAGGVVRIEEDTVVSPGSWAATVAAAGCVLDG